MGMSPQPGGKYLLTHHLSSCDVAGIDPTQGGLSVEAWPLSVGQASQGHSDWLIDAHITSA